MPSACDMRPGPLEISRNCVGRGVARQLEAASPGHRCQSKHWLHGPQQHAAGMSFGHAGNIQAVVIAVNEVHVGMSRRPEENGIARSAPGVSVRRRILDSEVGFIFDDTAGEQPPAFAANQQLAQQLASHGHRIAIEEFARKDLSMPQHRSREAGWLADAELLRGCMAIRHRK